VGVSADTGLRERARRAATWRLRTLDTRVRLATAPFRHPPNYLVIGAQKSGTTSLHAYLAAHPGVLASSVKEVEYFTKHYGRGRRWYLSHFPLAVTARAAGLARRVRPAVGESSATYLFHPRAPRRVSAFDPALKLIAVLRDPVDRAYSHYQMEFRWGRETLPFEDALVREESLAPELARMCDDATYESIDAVNCSYVARGRYAEQLARWLELFPREQLLVLTSDELLSDPAAAMARVAGFLHVPVRPAESYPLRGVREYGTMLPETRDRLARIFEPHNRALETMLGRELGWTRPRVLV
jgi:hypothetical protein